MAKLYHTWIGMRNLDWWRRRGGVPSQIQPTKASCLLPTSSSLLPRVNKRMRSNHLKVSEKREDLELKVGQILRKSILQTSHYTQHPRTLELEACAAGRVSIAK